MELNAFEALRDAVRESRLVSDKLRDLVGSSNRHGDLQVVRSSALRLIECVDHMIDYEQGEPLVRVRLSPPPDEDAPDPAPAPRRTPPHYTVARPTPKAAPPPPVEDNGRQANGRAPSGTQAALLKLIEKSPGKHTSGDLIRLTGLSSATVYTALGVMKKAGRLYTQKDDDHDGQSKWHSNEGSI